MELQGTNHSLTDGSAQVVPDLPMTWFRFLTAFALWIGSIGPVLVGLSHLMGLSYTLMGIDYTLAYAKYPMLLAADTVYGIACLVVGALFLLTRFRLVRFRRNGPLLLYFAFTLGILVPLAYSIVSSLVIGMAASELVGWSELLQVAGLAALLTLNVIYFRKRKHLFTR